MKFYKVTIIREAGVNPITNVYTSEEREQLNINATTPKEAYLQSFQKSKIKFQGQVRKVLIDGNEYFNDSF